MRVFMIHIKPGLKDRSHDGKMRCALVKISDNLC